MVLWRVCARVEDSDWLVTVVTLPRVVTYGACIDQQQRALRVARHTHLIDFGKRYHSGYTVF